MRKAAVRRGGDSVLRGQPAEPSGLIPFTLSPSCRRPVWARPLDGGPHGETLLPLTENALKGHWNRPTGSQM